MVKYCVAYGCKGLQTKGSGVQFHRFPFSRPEILKKWVQAIRREHWLPTAYSTLCSKHFTPDSYQTRPGAPVKLLKEDAVPSIFSFPDHLQKKVPFGDNLFESHRLDAQQKLKPFAEPTISNTAGPNDGQSNVESLEQHETEVTFHKQIKIESVISLSNVARTLDAASNATQERKAGRPSSSEKKSTIQQRRPSARLAVRGRRKWTNLYKVEYEINTQSKKIQNKLNTCPKEVRVVVEKIPRHTVQSTLEKSPPKKKILQGTPRIRSGKGPSKEMIRRCSEQSTSEEGASKEIIPRCIAQSRLTSEEGPSKKIIPRRSIQSTLEERSSKEIIPRCCEESTSEEGASKARIPKSVVESPSKETPSEKRDSSSIPSKKRSRGSTGTRPKSRPRKILRIDDESEETQVSCVLENSRDDAAEGEKISGNCVVCNSYAEQGTLLATLTNVSKEHFHEKLNRLVMGQDAITLKEDGVLCSVCTRLLNYMDRIEVELSMLKTALINCMRKKYVLKQDSNSSGQNHHESSGTLYTQNLFQTKL
ncbi:uncharacterized protein [Anabrus simplex]|uniref:uncharacterized protein isoform X2 n=1 Tax=Anabrus simplex TaxID=316456 RepID=UPI0035A2E525